MKNTTMLQLGTILTGSLLCAALAFAATDYGTMTNEELAAQRGSMHQATTEERNAFQKEWQNRVQKMSPEERQKAVGQPENAPRDGSGRQSGQGQGMGNSGSGGGTMGGGMGSGGSGAGAGMGGGMGRGGGGRR